MTLDDASAIQCELVELEFPMMFLKALEFALFKTYGIPTISRLLVQTKELTDPALVPKRYVDTTVLIREFCENPPSSERYREAIARMNYIHSVYQQAGKIKDDDLLYTLSLFALEPAKWINKYEWRALTSVEECAIGTFWKSIGDAMLLDYRSMKPSEKGWIDGLGWLDDIRTWSQNYEERHMVPASDNKKVADETVALLLWFVPKWLQHIGRCAVSALIDDRLREAIMYERPSIGYFVLMRTFFLIRKAILRYAMLPRLSSQRARRLSDKLNEHGRYHLKAYDNAPLYIRATLWERWSLQAWMLWLLGRPLPGDAERKHHSQGYKIGEIGPERMIGKGAQTMNETKARLEAQASGTCPFSMGVTTSVSSVPT
ncbi:hypothetical protein MMC26_002288 [Xylographa opegraphella]|nr:hypothetical protein [Xylographa opegraphella]